MVREVYSALDSIKLATTNGEKEGRVQFNKEQQLAVRDAIYRIQKAFTGFQAKFWELERSKRPEIKVKTVKVGQAPPAPTVPVPQAIQTQQTYAQKTGGFPALPRPAPRPPRYTTIVEVKDVEDPKETRREVQKTVKLTDVGGGFMACRKLKDGRIALDSHSEDQRAKLQQALQGDRFKVTEVKSTDPRILLTGVDAGYQKEELLKAIQEQNGDLIRRIGETRFKEGLRYEATRKCRNRERENWVFKATPWVFKHLMDAERVSIDLVMVHVEEEVPVTRCFRCNAFGHVAKYCKEKTSTCPVCGGPHDPDQCQSRQPDCPNCRKLGLENRNHSAADKTCPAYLRRMRAQRNRIQYGW